MVRKEITGNQYGRLTVVSYAGTVGKGVATWNCNCSCGNSVVVRYGNLKSGHTTSCGCALKDISTKHGMWGTPTYLSWDSIIRRCTTVNHARLKIDYADRGITVCDEWRTFAKFLADMGERPEGCTIERINNDMGYSKENCRWATTHDQARNKRSNVWVTINGITKCRTDWAKELGIPVQTLKYRLAKGLNVSP